MEIRMQERLLRSQGRTESSASYLLFLQGVFHGLIQGHGSPLLPLLPPGGLFKPGAGRVYVRLDHRALLWYPGSTGSIAIPRYRAPKLRRPADLSPRGGDAPKDFQGEIDARYLGLLL